ncbi:MAG: chalcone isomerase family protein [Opitutales bacterium]
MNRTTAIFTLTALMTSSAVASTLFPQRIEVGDQSLDKLGEYRYIYRLFFDLYEAALFTEPGADAADVLRADVAFHLQFRYLREIDKSIILESADLMLERNLNPEERASIKERVEIINEGYTSVKKGYESSLSYKPDIGTTLSINGEKVVTIKGKDFAELYFRIWLGKKAISKNLKLNLLGKN